MATTISTFTHMIIEDTTDVNITTSDEHDKLSIYFRSADDPMSALAFSGSHALLKEAFSKALDLLDQQASA